MLPSRHGGRIELMSEGTIRCLRSVGASVSLPKRRLISPSISLFVKSVGRFSEMTIPHRSTTP